MSNNAGTAFSVIMSIFLAVLGLFVMIIGLSGALSGDEMGNGIRALLWVLAIAGGLMLYGAVTMFISANKKSADVKKDEANLTAEAKKPVNIDEARQSVQQAAEKGFTEKNTLLTHWTYNKEEWETWTKHEFSFRKEEAIIFLVVLCIVGTLLLPSMRSMSYFAAFLSSLFVGGIITAIRFGMAHSDRKANSSKLGDVVISARSVLINGKYHTLNDEHKTLSSVKIITDEKPNVFEFSVVWNTRKGPTGHEVRVPIPEGKMEDALKLKEVFTNDVIGRY